MLPEARLSGLPAIERKPFYHKREHLLLYREIEGEIAEPTRIITVYAGLEVSIVAWLSGKVIDADNYVAGDSPMGVRNAGWLPNTGTLSCFYDKKMALNEIAKLICGEGGLKAYYGTEDIDLLAMKEGELPLEAFIYWLAKGIGGMSAILKGKPDGVIVGGRWVNYAFFLKKLKGYLSHLYLLESKRIR